LFAASVPQINAVTADSGRKSFLERPSQKGGISRRLGRSGIRHASDYPAVRS
jgi:hypothetical protein